MKRDKCCPFVYRWSNVAFPMEDIVREMRIVSFRDANSLVELKFIFSSRDFTECLLLTARVFNFTQLYWTIDKDLINCLNLSTLSFAKQIKIGGWQINKIPTQIRRRRHAAAYERGAMCASKRVGKFTFLPQSRQPAAPSSQLANTQKLSCKSRSESLALSSHVCRERRGANPTEIPFVPSPWPRPAVPRDLTDGNSRLFSAALHRII